MTSTNCIGVILNLLCIIIAVIVFFTLKSIYSKRKLFKFASKLKGYRFYPIIGSGYHLIKKDVFSGLNDAIKKFGSPCNVWVGHEYFYITSDAMDAKILLNHPNSMNKSFVYQYFKYFFGESALLLLPATIFGIDYKLQGSDEIHLDQLLSEMQDLAFGALYELIFLPVETLWFYTKHGKKFKLLNVEVQKLMAKMLKERRAKHKEKGYIENKNMLPLLDAMLESNELTDQEIHEQSVLFIAAATDTSGANLEFFFILLGMNPEIQEKIYEEIVETVGLDGNISYQDLPKFKYLERVMFESMRLFPVTPLVARQLTDDIDLGSRVLPKGANAVIDIFDMHRREKYYKDPKKFDPDRFLPEEVKKREEFGPAYIPFSTGARNCIGLNAVETYVPWNLHEPSNGYNDFGAGGSDMQDFLNITEFLKTAQEEDLLAIVRPGPFICAEFEFGGMPSWLLRETGIKVRTSDEKYMKYVRRYFNILLPILHPLQFTKGGPIIMLQVENEYGSTYDPPSFIPDKKYLAALRQLFLDNGIVELLFTSDGTYMSGTRGTLPGVLFQTSNFGGDPDEDFAALKKLQPGRPVMAMEFWAGWFDHWSEVHNTKSNDEFYNIYEKILKYPASVNMYMFHGGTSFGFLNGANLANSKTDNSGYQPDTTSYDYDAALSESGDYTLKYVSVKQLLRQYNPVQTRLPRTPSITYKVIYQPVAIQSQLLLDEILDNVEFRLFTKNLVSMEMLPINNNSGQSYGYIVYRRRLIDIPANSVLTIKGRVCDTVVVLVNGILMSKPLRHVEDLSGFGFWKLNDSSLVLGPEDVYGATLDLVVENWGRNNFGYINQFNQFKGLWQGDVLLNGKVLTGWEIVPLEFKKSWTTNLKGWHQPVDRWSIGPAIYRSELHIDQPQDTFVDMRRWTKGIVIINGFVLGRYARIGPQQTLYLPAPFLKKGWNDILVFEHYIGSSNVAFTDRRIYKTRNGKQRRN